MSRTVFKDEDGCQLLTRDGISLEIGNPDGTITPIKIATGAIRRVLFVVNDSMGTIENGDVHQLFVQFLLRRKEERKRKNTKDAEEAFRKMYPTWVGHDNPSRVSEQMITFIQGFLAGREHE